jgi:hypothetical protein
MNQQAINAHHIARHLRAIANILRSAERPLTDEAEEVLSFDLANLTKLYTELAEDLEATAPFTPLTDVEKDKVLGLIADDVADYSTGERAELLTADWTEADWRIEYDQLEEYMSEDE